MTMDVFFAGLIMVLNLIGVIWFGKKVMHTFLVLVGYSIVFCVLLNMNATIFAIVLIIIAVITLIAIIVAIVNAVREKNYAAYDKKSRQQKEEKQHQVNEALFNAIKGGDKRLVQELLEKGADVNYVTYEGKYLLDYAEDDEIISCLRSHGAKTKAEIEEAEIEEADEAVIAGDIYYGAQNYDKAFEFFKKAADLGNADAQWKLGICYLFGEGILKDEEKGVEWIKKAAEKGHCYAQVDLGVCYFNGTGVIKNYSEAFNWLKKPAEQGICKAQAFLGMCYSTGAGVTHDIKKGVEWFKKAAEQGNADAQFFLGLAYQTGAGENADLNNAVKYFTKAAEQGHKEALVELKKLCSNGLYTVGDDY